jgi:hypothetical protein
LHLIATTRHAVHKGEECGYNPSFDLATVPALSTRTQRVDLVQHYDTWLPLLGLVEDSSKAFLCLAMVCSRQFRSVNNDAGATRRRGGDRSSEVGLSCAGWTMQENTSRWFETESVVQLWMTQG